MAVLPIVKLGHPALRKRAEAIRQITPELKQLVANMIDTMRVNEGIGLAANQVNVLQRVFVIDLSLVDENQDARAYINPRILSREGREVMEEGCLSIPEVRADVERAATIRVEYQTLDGKTVQETLEGLVARVFQHELDHLNGVLFIDHITPIQRKLIEPQLNKIREANSIL
ncbi:MAG: peptide deformylase [Calditrichaeota bacterium]|nr:peptide deformylase [Calditrichota bacterium]